MKKEYLMSNEEMNKEMSFSVEDIETAPSSAGFFFFFFNFQC